MGINKKMLQLGSHRSIIREIFEYSRIRGAQIGKDKVFDFSLGNPSVPTPEIVNDTICELVKSEGNGMLHGYTSAQGDFSVREKISSEINRKYGTSLSPDNIYMTCGAAASLSISLKAIIEKNGEECVVFAPYFTEYRVFIENAQGTLVSVPPLYTTLEPDISLFEKSINEKTKAVIINSPNNPSGVIYKKSTILAICEVLEKKQREFGHDIYLISDEPYRELAYEDKEIPYLMCHYKNTIVCYSYSKSLSLPGERIGYIAVNPEMENARDLYLAICGAGRSLGYVCAPSLFQHVIARIDEACVDISIYRENRDLLYNGLTELGYECIQPDGAFYLFLKAPGNDAYSFYETAKKHEVLLVPCDDFGVSGYVRIAYCVDKKRILGALPAFAEIMKEYK